MYPLARRSPHGEAPRLIIEQRDDALRERLEITGWHEATADAVVDDFGDAADRRRHCWHARGSGFEQDHRQPLRVRRHYREIEIRQEADQVGAKAGQDELPLQAALGDQSLQVQAQRPLAEQHEPRFGPLPGHQRRRFNENRKAFLGAESTRRPDQPA